MNYNVGLQHEKKKYHAIERIMLLMDKDSFCEIGSGITGDDTKNMQYEGVITGYGLIEGKSVYVFSQDFTQRGGSIGLIHGRKIAYLVKKAIENKCPVIGIYDSGGARIGEGINALAGCGEMMFYNTLASGYIPQISVVVGPCAGAAAYSPAITDFIFCVNTISNLYITGTNVVESVTGEKCSAEELGGAKVHASVSGVAHVLCSNEKECFSKVRKLVDILPNCCETKPADRSVKESLSSKNFEQFDILPDERKDVYDIRVLIKHIIDMDSFFEIHENFAKSLVVGFAKINDCLVGIVANQPLNNCGVLDCDSSDKGARFVRYCDAYNIPIITFVDTPGYLPGIEQEHKGIIRHGAKLLFAYAEATTIKITIVVRKAYGGAYIAMGSKHLGADYVYALPDAEIAVMGAEGAVSILNKKEFQNISQSDSQNDYKTLFDQKVNEYKELYMNSKAAVKAGFVDEIIDMSLIRNRIIKDLYSLQHKNTQISLVKKHSNIPL